MKKTLLPMAIGLLLIGVDAFCADGDLVVNGKMGVGTTSPSAALEIRGTEYNFFSQGLGSDLKIVHDHFPTVWMHSTSTNSGVMAVLGSDGSTLYVSPTSGNSYNGWWLAIGGSSGYVLDVRGNVYSTGQYLGSDLRWKKDVERISNALSLVQRLEGVTFVWRANEFPDRNFEKGRQVGLVAQNVEKALPELVKTDPEGYKAVSYEKLTAVLVEAIKDQQKQIGELKKRIKKLEKR